MFLSFHSIDFNNMHPYDIILLYLFLCLDFRSFQNFISNADPNTLAALNPGNSEEVPADMVKTASNMISKMSPEELQKMLELASSSNFNNFKPGSIPPNVSPDMLKTASDMMSKMPPEELQKMFGVASSLNGRGSSSTQGPVTGNRSSSDYTESSENSAVNAPQDVGETSSQGIFPNLRSSPQSSFPASAGDLQEQMRTQMKDPAMQQVRSISTLKYVIFFLEIILFFACLFHWFSKCKVCMFFLIIFVIFIIKMLEVGA